MAGLVNIPLLWHMPETNLFSLWTISSSVWDVSFTVIWPCCFGDPEQGWISQQKPKEKSWVFISPSGYEHKTEELRVPQAPLRALLQWLSTFHSAHLFICLIDWFLYLLCLSVCMCLCECVPHVCSTLRGQKRVLDLWSWSYRWLWATQLRCRKLNSGFSARTVYS